MYKFLNIITDMFEYIEIPIGDVLVSNEKDGIMSNLCSAKIN